MPDNMNLEDFKKDESTLDYVTRINSVVTRQSSKSNKHLPMNNDEEDTNIKQIYIEPGIMDEEQHERLWSILKKYSEVFNNDISEGYNNASGEFDVEKELD